MTYPGIEHDKELLASNPDMAAVEERRAERIAEYDQYVAIQPIPWGTVLAHNVGDRVPASNAERLHWADLGLVAKRTTKAGRAVLEATGQATTEEREAWVKADKEAAKTTAVANVTADDTAVEKTTPPDSTPKTSTRGRAAAKDEGSN